MGTLIRGRLPILFNCKKLTNVKLIAKKICGEICNCLILKSCKIC